MQIIEKMPDEQFEEICDAGVELVQELVKVLERHGLGLEHGSTVLAVAAAGIAKGSHIVMSDFVETIESVAPMWREESRQGKRGIIFDPAHRRSDYVAVELDPSAGN